MKDYSLKFHPARPMATPRRQASRLAARRKRLRRVLFIAAVFGAACLAALQLS